MEMKRYIKVFCILLATMLLFEMQCYAGIDFEVEKVVWDSKAVYDIKEGVIYSQGYALDWSKLDDIPTIEAMPEPNVTWLYNEYGGVEGYVTKIDGIYYYAGRTGDRGMPLPVIPLGNTVPEDLSVFTKDYRPDLFPYNAKNRKTVFELRDFNESLGSLRYAYGNIAKWVFDRDKMDNTRIFVDGIYSIETNLDFGVHGEPLRMKRDDMAIMFWEDEDTFYIRNYNILLKTPKQPLYDALNELEKVPKIKYNDTFLAFEVPPVIENDYTLVPIRFLFEQMGAEVTWNQDTQTATVSQDNTTITFLIDDTEASVNGQAVRMKVPARLINGKTMVPVRFLSEELGYTVDWDGENRIITIK